MNYRNTSDFENVPTIDYNYHRQQAENLYPDTENMQTQTNFTALLAMLNESPIILFVGGYANSGKSFLLRDFETMGITTFDHLAEAQDAWTHYHALNKSIVIETTGGDELAYMLDFFIPRVDYGKMQFVNCRSSAEKKSDDLIELIIGADVLEYFWQTDIMRQSRKYGNSI